MERRLSAILAADVVGYSRLMGANEVGTLTSLKSHRVELIDPTIAEHQGRIVKLTGDGMLVEFSSVVSAVECAAEIQRDMRSRNVGVAEDRRIEFRIGINLGDVIVEDDDIFGDGVNIASRIESVAKPGGVAVSSSVRENVGNKLDFIYEDMGDQDLKNIDFPVRVFNVLIGDAPARSNGADAAPAEANDVDKPSIAVLPFINMSDDPGQEYFSDGITEDIITDLSKVSGLFVVGRNTSFTFKGKAVQLQEAAAELGVKFLLEGSVRKAGQRVRVNGQLIDGATGGHLWADRYDRDLTDIFAIQDEITQSIVDQLKVRLLPKEKKAITKAPTENVEAYTYYLKGRQYFHNTTKTFLTLARRMFTKAVELDPNYARAYAGIANCDARLEGWYNVPMPPGEILATADKALSLDPNLAEAHAARGVSLSNSDRRDEAVAAFERALELDPNSFNANLFYARFCLNEGALEKGRDLLVRALEIQPDDFQAPIFLFSVCNSLGFPDEAERYGRLGVKRAEEALRQFPESSRPTQIGACVLAALGETDRAKEWLEHSLAIDSEDSNVRYNAACTYALMGESERALDLLDAWKEAVGHDAKRWIKHDPDFDSLRDHPRFKKLLELVDAES
jgi:adenylate cyclase